MVEEVKRRVDLVDLISRYTTVKKAGSTYKANCPFHDERTPSFVIFPSSDRWHCFGACGEGGDAFNFLMKKENLDFREALQMLAEEVGVELEEQRPAENRQRNTIYDVNAAAAAYYQEVLAHHPAAEVARKYVAERKIDPSTTQTFQIGYSLDSWDSLRNHLERAGFSADDQLLAGLLKKNEARNSTYDAFRGRLMIPIRDRQGRIIGFGGRILGEGQPKYLNTSDTALFHKSKIVYGLDLAHQAIRQAERVVIVEGYMDVIAAHQHGVENTVACMGTAVTADQLQQLQRYTSNFVLALDADAAGQQATIRGVNQARQALTRVRKPKVMPTGRVRLEERLGAQLFIASMPEGRDPDDVIRQSIDEWHQLIEKAKPLVDFYFQLVAQQYDLQSAHGKAQCVSELAPLIAEIDDEIEQQHYIQQLSRLIQIDETTISRRVEAAGQTLRIPLDAQKPPGQRAGIQRLGGQKPGQQKADGQKFGGNRNAGQQAAPSGNPRFEPLDADSGFGQIERPNNATDQRAKGSYGVQSPKKTAPAISVDPSDGEDFLLANLLRNPELLINMADLAHQKDVPPLSSNDLKKIENQEIIRALKTFITTDEQWDIALFQETIPTFLHGRLADLLAHGTQLPGCDKEDLPGELLKVLLRMRIHQLNEKNNQIRFLIQEAHTTGDAETVRSLQMSHNSSIRNRNHLDAILAQNIRRSKSTA